MIWYHHFAWDANLAGTPCDSLCHVSGTSRPDTLFELGSIRVSHGVGRTTDFERAYGLEVLELEIYLSGGFIQVQSDQRSTNRSPLNPLLSLDDIPDGN